MAEVMCIGSCKMGQQVAGAAWKSQGAKGLEATCVNSMAAFQHRPQRTSGTRAMQEHRAIPSRTGNRDLQKAQVAVDCSL